MEYGKKIAALRKSRNMTQEELGKVLSVTYQAVSKWERDESLPDFETMSRIAKYFNVPLNYFTDEDEQTEETASTTANPSSAVTADIVGMCTQCGKMLTADEVAEMQPKIICKSCSDRLKEQAEQERASHEARLRALKNNAIRDQHGHGIDAPLFISVIVAAVLYIGLSIYCNSASEYDKEFAGVLLFLVPLILFGAVHSLCSFINEIRDSYNFGPEGYTRNISLITAGIVSGMSLVCFLALYLATKEKCFVVIMIISVVFSFTFVSQMMWGGFIQAVFTAGGFTFKLPGFIFSLTVDSILWMIITKFFLSIIAAVVFVVTTVIVALFAIISSLFTFIPSVLIKSVKDKIVEKENK